MFFVPKIKILLRLSIDLIKNMIYTIVEINFPNLNNRTLFLNKQQSLGCFAPRALLIKVFERIVSSNLYVPSR